MTFLRMLISGVDPFAVYAAERELATRGIRVPREQLASHYLIQGQFRTFMAKLTAPASVSDIKAAFATALIEGPNESANPRFVSPVRTGILLSVIVLAAVAIEGVFRIWRLGAAADQVRWDWMLAAAAVLVSSCMAYAFLGARIGRTKANKFMSVAVALAFVGFMYWLTRYLGDR